MSFELQLLLLPRVPGMSAPSWVSLWLELRPRHESFVSLLWTYRPLRLDRHGGQYESHATADGDISIAEASGRTLLALLA